MARHAWELSEWFSRDSNNAKVVPKTGAFSLMSELLRVRICCLIFAEGIGFEASLAPPGSVERCTYAIDDEEEAFARRQDPSIAGTTVDVTSLYYGEVDQLPTTLNY